MLPAPIAHTTTEFEGHALVTLVHDGRPCWIARQVGEAIGYALGGRRLVNLIRGEWSAEFEEGKDYDLLTGKALLAVRALPVNDTGCVSLKSNFGLMVLYESGVHLVATKTRRPAGVRLRRFLADEVLPQLARDGHYSPGRTVRAGRIVARDEAATTPAPVRQDEDELERLREERAGRELVLQERVFQVGALRQALHAVREAGDVAPAILAAYEVFAAEIALGTSLPDLRPSVPPGWESPTRIARRLGVSPQWIGRVISHLGLRGNLPGLSRPVLTRARGSDLTVVSYLYSPEAVRRIEVAVTRHPEPRVSGDAQPARG
ncbi:hypothetical protein L6R50_19730 [Myxococcota bacterium]|nr:hypothetical protein [Myxococcota bacterium]